ncbi:hypothetical protein CW751_10900 [Brumimicrobium salinarum]|uniref:Type IX secretion system membrane protein PorP/SprF n=1 Tax=Brumimicrobium salinarum TaxID=2058658 RepID=A0A2I0R0P6_9FLAO|nr:type IX secretion system membrane protein PorP/SprF [Brumimicrobium salinarum]PKR80166.1 hypothetical protein CW751_10900 [Brumimicrobium salinarum]
MKKITYIITVLLLISLSTNKAQAQQDEQLSFQSLNPLYYNPAYAGSSNSINITGIGRFQWVGMEGAPNTQWLTVHAPIIGKSLGMGIHTVNDQIGSRNRTGVYYDISSSIRLNDKGARLAFGLSAGVDIISRNFTSLTIHDQNDIHNSQYSYSKFNLGAGLFYYNEKTYIGLSMPRVLKYKDEDLISNVEHGLYAQHLFLTFGQVFQLNSSFKLKATLLAKHTPETPIAIDLGLHTLMYDKINVGVIYRLTEALGVNMYYQVKNFMRIGYGYEFPLNRLANYQTGSHEILLQFDIKMKNSVYKSPRYF